MQPMLSIIVPVYKTQEYLERCIEAILKTNYQKFEVVLVDDGSPDECPQICDRYAEKYSNIYVLHEENQGVYAARNAGIEYAHGEYIAFCDSDDCVPENSYELLMERAAQTGADVVRGLVRQIDKNIGEDCIKKRTDSILRSATSAHYCNVYKKEMIIRNNIKFQPFTLGEDISFMIQILNCAERIVSVNEVTYYYLIRSENSQNKSAIQIKDFRHYYDNFRWREWVVNYMNSSEKLLQMYGTQMGGGLCPLIDKNWLKYNQKERELCFKSLYNIAKNIDWSMQKVNANGYLWTDAESFLNMTEKQYTKFLKKRFYIINPIKNMLKR